MLVLAGWLSAFSTGCSTGVFIQHDPTGDSLDTLTPGTYSRKDLVDRLGDPVISEVELGVEVFEHDGALTEMLLPGIPYRTAWTYYTLVTYDEAGNPIARDTGGYVYRSRLTSGRFSLYFPDTLLEAEEVPVYRQQVSENQCALTILLVGNRWSRNLRYDWPIQFNGTAWQLQRQPYDSYRYVLIDVSDNTSQTLQVFWGGTPESDERQFECPPGKRRFVTIEAGADEPIAVQEDEPTELAGRLRVLAPKSPSTAGTQQSARSDSEN